MDYKKEKVEHGKLGDKLVAQEEERYQRELAEIKRQEEEDEYYQQLADN